VSNETTLYIKEINIGFWREYRKEYWGSRN